VVIDPVVGDIRLVGEGGPGAEHKGKLLDGLDRLGEVDRHEPPRHLLLRLTCRTVMWGIAMFRFTAFIAILLGAKSATAQSTPKTPSHPVKAGDYRAKAMAFLAGNTANAQTDGSKPKVHLDLVDLASPRRSLASSVPRTAARGDVPLTFLI